MDKKLRVLIVGGDGDREFSDEVKANLDYVHLSKIKDRLTNGVCEGAQAVIVISRWVSNAMRDKARQYAKANGIPLVQAQTGNYILHELERYGILKDPIRLKKGKKPEPEPGPEEVPSEPSPKPEPTEKQRISVGLNPDELWSRYGQKAIDSIKTAMKPGDKLHEEDILTLLADPSAVGIPKGDLVEILPELAVRGVIVNIRGKTWKIPVVVDFGETVPEEDDSEVEPVLKEAEEEGESEPETEPEADSKRINYKGEPRQTRRSILDMVEKLAGLPPGPYENHGDLWRQVIQYEDFRKPDGTYGTDAQLWHWVPEAIDYGIVEQDGDGKFVIIHDDRIVLTPVEKPAHVAKHPEGTQFFFGCPRHGRHDLDDRRNPTRCIQCDSALTYLCDDEKCKFCPPCEVCAELGRKKAQEERDRQKEIQAKKAKTPEEIKKAVFAHYDGAIPVLDKYAIPIRALKRMIPGLYWDSMACQTVAKIVSVGHHDNVMPLKELFDKLEWDRLAYDTIKNLPVETLAPFLKDEMKDLDLTCIECGSKFLFTVSEQKFFEGKFEEVSYPKRCRECRRKLRGMKP